MTTPHRRARLATTTALALCSLQALAQTPPAASGVTVYGLVDVAVASVKGAAGGARLGDQRQSQLLSGGLSTSHFGLRGSEDLGGGLQASFELASFLRMDTGLPGRNDAIGAPVNVAADPFWSRSAWVGLASPSLGRVRLGNITTLAFFQSITSNAFGDSTVFSPLLLVSFIGSPLSGGTGWTNQVVVDTPRLGGFSASAAVSAAEGQGGRNGSARVQWVQGPVSLGLVWQDVKKNPSTFADGTSANNTRSWQLAATWNLDKLKLWGHLGAIDNRGTEAAPQAVGYRVAEVSASLDAGPGRVVAGLARRHTGDTPSPVPSTAAGGNVKRQVASLGYLVDLSRRTDVYAVLTHDSTDTRTLGTGGAAPSVLSASATQGAVGLRHRF